MAPSIVSEAVKGAVLAAKVFEDIGFDTYPKHDEKRTDIIQTINLGDGDKLVKFCEGIQMASPIESYVKPVPAPMPGYPDDGSIKIIDDVLVVKF